MNAPRTLHIVTLDADTPVPNVLSARGLYSTIFQTLLTAAAARLSSSYHHQPPCLKWSAYNAVLGDYPSSPADIDAIIITGSASSAYDNAPWIHRLAEYVSALYKHSPHIKFFGSCFGHQLLCQALLGPRGGYVEKHPGGWELGVHPVRLSPQFVEAFPVDVAALPSAKTEPAIRLQFVHADHVVLPSTGAGNGTDSGTDRSLSALPPSWMLVGSTPQCHIQGVYEPGRILTLQGHFEFDRFVNAETIRVFGAGWEKAFLEKTMEAIEKDDDAEWAAEVVMAFFLGTGDGGEDGEVRIEGGLLTPPQELVE